jgi:3'-phosphoadenosine 5'-phosphosulfate sulfotransferase (PAPS reductase)/FAD synthetase
LNQLALFEALPRSTRDLDVIDVSEERRIDLSSYDDVIVAFSGGKDSVACVLHLLEQGIRPELWHHDIDGRAGSFFDWPVTPAYCDAFAAAFGLRIYHSWRVGGLGGELMKQNDRTKPVMFETPDGIGTAGGERGKISTRRRFPALAADLRTRWCSSVAKIDVMAAAIANQDRFIGKRILVVTGERAQESSARARYATLEAHRSHAPGPRAQRHVDHWRPIHAWTEQQVWELLEKHRIDAHPCYHLGWGRASCQTCIFGSKDQWASIRRISPLMFRRLADLEVEFGHTLRKGVTLDELADAGTPYDMDPEDVAAALSTVYERQIVGGPWRLPKGAYGESAGPT